MFSQFCTLWVNSSSRCATLPETVLPRDRFSLQNKIIFVRESRLKFGECEKWRASGADHPGRQARRRRAAEEGNLPASGGAGVAARPSVHRPPLPPRNLTCMHCRAVSTVDVRLQRVPKCEREWVGQLVSEVCDLHE